MTNFIVILIVVVIVGAAVIYIVREKKRGVKCIGCPSASTCPNSGRCTGSCDSGEKTECSCHTED